MAPLLVLLLALGAHAPVRAQVTMDDLGYPEPDWKFIGPGNHENDVLQLGPNQVFDNIQPGTAGRSVCEFVDNKCKTQVGWIAAAHNLTKDFFDDPEINYLLRFPLYGACYKSTQYSFNKEAQYCAVWWLDPFTQKKINTSEICYTMEVEEPDPFNPGTTYLRKYGCAHKFNGTQETFESHQQWFGCYNFVGRTNTAALESCRRASFSLQYDMDGNKLQRMLDFIQGTGAVDCAAEYARRRGAEQGSMTNAEFCENFVSSSALFYMQNNRGFMGTAEQPQTLEPEFFPPPPPNPPPPFPPPSPPFPPPIGRQPNLDDSFGAPGAPTTPGTEEEQGSAAIATAASAVLAAVFGAIAWAVL